VIVARRGLWRIRENLKRLSRKGEDSKTEDILEV